MQYLLNIGVWLKMSATSKLASILSSEQGQISCFEIEVFYLNQRRSKKPMYDEIKAESFLYPPASKQKFTSDLDLCISHLVENNLRGDNTFLSSLPSRVFCHASEEGFESLIGLIAGIRTSFNSNNQSMENQ